MNANSYDSPGRAGGNREDLSEVVTLLEPEETPFTSGSKKGRAPASTLVEQQADSLRRPRKTGSKEGQDAGKGNNKAKNRIRFGTYIARIQDEYGTTDVQQAISKQGGTAGVSDEFARAKALTLREMKRDMEAINCSDNEHNGGNENDMMTRGCFTWLATNGGSTAPVVPDSHRTTAWTGSGDTTGQVITGVTAIQEPQFNGILQFLQRVHGGKREYDCIAGDNVIKTVDNFTNTGTNPTQSVRRVLTNADEHEITLQVKIFDSSFGRVNMIPTQFNKVDANGAGDPYAALILMMSLWELNFLENLHAVDGEEGAGGQSGYAKAMWANNCLSPKGNGMFYNT